MAVLLLLIAYPLNLLAQRKQPSDLGLQPDGDARVRAAAAQRG